MIAGSSLSVAPPAGAVGTAGRRSGIRPRWRLHHRLQLGEHVAAVAWTGSGDVAVAATLDGRVQAIDVERAGGAQLIAEHAGGALSVDVSPGDVVASGGEDGRMRLVPLGTNGRAVNCDAGGSWVEHVRWSPRGDCLASAAGRVVRFWKPDGALSGAFDGHPGSVSALWWDQSGRTLTTACSDGLRLLGPRRRRPLAHIPLDAAGTVLFAAESPDERYVAMNHLGGTVSVVQMSTARSIQYGGFPGKVRQLVWSRDGRRLAVASGEKVAVFGFSPRRPDRERARVLRGHRGRIGALCFVADLLVSGCDAGQVLFWAEARNMRRVGGLDLKTPSEGLFPSADARFLAVTLRGGELQIFALVR